MLPFLRFACSCALIAACIGLEPLSLKGWADQPAGERPRQQQPRGPKGEGGRPGGDQRGLIAKAAAFQTDVPAHPFDIILVRPAPNSVTLSIVAYAPDAPAEGYVEFARADDAHFDRTPTQLLNPAEPASFLLEGLQPDNGYVYRLRHRRRDPGAQPAPFASSELFAFHTTRPPGSSFTFTIQADSHLDSNMSPQVYEQMLANALADRPDFHIDLGDTFMTDKRRDFHEAAPNYLAQRYYFGRLCSSASLFMVLGNHDGESGFAGRPGDPDSMSAWSYAQRTRLFPPPLTPPQPSDARQAAPYTGRTAMTDGRAANYFAFTWGDAQFIVLDPFWPTTQKARAPGAGRAGGGGGREGDKPAQAPDADTTLTDESWSLTLGREQYDWLDRTLTASTAPYKFVFIHHLVGGRGRAARGGVESAPYFEWGGQNADGSPGFAAHRPGWPMPIHALLVKHAVSAVFHGHDHLYVHAELDGLTYQCVPQPGNTRAGTRSAEDYGYRSGTILASPGHLRVSVAPEGAEIAFIRAAITDPAPGRRAEAAPNAAIVARYAVAPRPAPSR